MAEECQVFRDDLVCQDFLGLKDHLDHKDQRVTSVMQVCMDKRVIGVLQECRASLAHQAFRVFPVKMVLQVHQVFQDATVQRG